MSNATVDKKETPTYHVLLRLGTASTWNTNAKGNTSFCICATTRIGLISIQPYINKIHFTSKDLPSLYFQNILAQSLCLRALF